VYTTGEATTGDPTTGVYTTGDPTTGVYTTGDPTTGVYTTGDPTTGVYTTGDPTTGVYTTGVYTTGEYTTGVYTTGDPTTGVYTTGGGSSGGSSGGDSDSGGDDDDEIYKVGITTGSARVAPLNAEVAKSPVVQENRKSEVWVSFGLVGSLFVSAMLTLGVLYIRSRHTLSALTNSDEERLSLMSDV